MEDLGDKLQRREPRKQAGWIASGYTKVVAVAMSLVFSFVGMLYSDMKTRISVLEDRVSFLYQDKLSRSEFKEEFKGLREEIAASRADSAARLDATRTDIVERINMLIDYNNNSRRTQ